MKHTDVIRRPLVTEKTTIAREQQGEVVVFEWRGTPRRSTCVAPSRSCSARRSRRCARKSRTGKFKRQGRFEGQRPDWKKAWVRLKAGEKVPDFIEGT
jgi:large subunit ribosomal protein L23